MSHFPHTKNTFIFKLDQTKIWNIHSQVQNRSLLVLYESLRIQAFPSEVINFSETISDFSGCSSHFKNPHVFLTFYMREKVIKIFK